MSEDPAQYQAENLADTGKPTFRERFTNFSRFGSSFDKNWRRFQPQIVQIMQIKSILTRGCRLLLWGGLILWSSASERAAADFSVRLQSRYILLIHSCNVAYSQFYQALPAFLQELSASPVPHILEQVELDSQWDFSPISWEQKLALYWPALKAGKYSAVIVFQDLAYSLLQKNLPQIHPDTAVLFAGLSEWSALDLQQHPNMSGVIENIALRENIFLALRLFSGLERAVVLLDGSLASDRIRRQLLEQEYQVGGLKVEVLHPDKLSTTAMLEYIAKLDQQSVVVFYAWFSGKSIDIRQPSRLCAEISAASSVPVLVLAEVMLQYAVLGGLVNSEQAAASRVGEMLRDVLEGRHAGHIPVETQDDRLILNWPALQASAVPTERIPAPAEIRGGTESGWMKRQQEMLFFGVLMAILSLLVLGGYIVAAWRRRSRQRSAALFSHLPLRFFVVDSEGNILHSELGNRFQLEQRQYILRHLRDFPDLDYEKFLSVIRETIRSGSQTTLDFAYRGTLRTAYFSKLPPGLYKREVVIWVSQDTTELQQSRNFAREMAERFLQTLKSIGDAVVVSDLSGNITMLNKVASRLTGWDEDEAVGRKVEEVFQVVNGRTSEPVISPVTLALQEGKIVERADHTDLISRTGQRYHIADSAAPVRAAGGEIAGAVLVFRDVTEQYRQRDLFNANLQSLEFATRLANMQTFECLPEEVPISPDKRKFWVLDDCNRPQPELSWVYGQDILELSRRWSELLNGSLPVLRQSFRSQASGKMRYYNIIASWRRYGATDERRIFGVVQDITASEEAKQKYLDNALLFQTIMDVLPCYFFIKDAGHAFRYLQANDTFCEFVNCRKEELLGRNDAELRARGDNLGQFAGDDDQVVLSGGKKIESTERVLRSDGSFRYIRMVRMPYQRYDGVLLLIGLGFDITELEQAKLEEAEARKMLTALLDTVPVGIVAKDADNDFRYTLCNRFFSRMTGLEAQSVLGRQDYEISLFSGQTAQLRAEDAQVMDSEQPAHQILETNFPEREHQIFQVSKLPVKIPGGKNLLLSSYMDITSNYYLEQQQKALIGKLNNFVESERILNNCLSQIVLETDFHKNMQQIFGTIRQQLRCDRVSVGRYCSLTGRYEQICEWTDPALQEPWEQDLPVLRQLYAGLEEIFRQGRLLILSDLQQSEYSDQLQGCNTQSLIAAPINVEGELWGMISFFFIREQRLFSDIDVNIIRSTSKIVALAQMQKKQMTAIQSADQEKRLILNNIQIPIWLYDAKGELLRVNSAVCRHFGISESLALELGEDVLFGGLVAPRDRPLATVLHSGSAAICEIAVNHFEFLVTAEPIVGSDGAVINIIETAINITDINESKRQQEIALKSAQEADLAKTFFLATMSHEIRTPLNAVIGFSELLQRERLTRAEQAEYLQAIHYAGNALLQLINDILDLSKIEAGQIPIVLEKADLAVICRELASVFRHLAEEKNLSLELAIAEMPLLFIDQLRMRQVLFNLLGNAVKFTEQGGVRISATFASGEDGLGNLEIKVSDTGKGISKEDQEKIFKPFVQLNATRGTCAVNNGTGLGLAISQQLVEKMGGALSLRSASGQGSCFSICIPEVVYTERQEPVAANQAISPPPESLPSSQWSVLIVDDVPVNLKVLAATLKNCGAEVSMAASGAEALELLQQGRSFDIIFTDMWMPEMNGEQLCLAIKELPGCRNLPVVAVTADIESHDNFSLEKFFGVILKPVTLEKISKYLSALKAH